MKQIIFANWNFMRLFRLGLGIAVLVQASLARDALFIVLGIFFTAMPVFNIGCGGTNGCYVTPKKKSAEEKDITYEEVV